MIGGIQKSPDRLPRNHHRPYVTVRNVQRGWLDLSHVERFEVTEAELERLRLHTDDLLIVEGNGSLDQVGRSALFQQPNDDQEWIHQNHVIRVRLDANVILPAFVGLFLQSAGGAAQLLERARTTSGLHTLSVGKVESLLVPKPDLDIQQQVVGALSSQQMLVERARTAAEAQVEAASLLRSATLRSEISAGRQRGWPVVSLESVSEIVSGVTLGRDPPAASTRTVPYLTVANVKDGYLELDDVRSINVTEPELEKWRLKPGDLLLTEGGDPDKLGRGTVWRGEIVDCIHQNHIFRVRFRSSELLPEFAAAQVSSPYGKAYFLAHAKQTTGIVTINQHVLRTFP